VAGDPESPQAQQIRLIARKLAAQVSIQNVTAPPIPKVEILLGAQ
jgi:hypothetical protein